MTDDYSRRAIAAALELARQLGLRCGHEPALLRDAANVLLHLSPAPVVARVSTTTALVRRPAEIWLRHDLAMASYLAAQNFPAVPPSPELPPGPHLHHGFAISFWQYVEHDPTDAATAQETAGMLRELHHALRHYPGPLDRLSPFYEIPGWLTDAGRLGALTAEDIALLRSAHAEIAGRIEAARLPEQPLHGDAHRGNLLRTPRGLLWTDFEDCCRGPALWDLACFVRSSQEGREAATAAASSALGLNPGELQASLEPFLEARDLQGTVWLPILATRFPDRRALAAEWLAAAGSRYGSPRPAL